MERKVKEEQSQETKTILPDEIKKWIKAEAEKIPIKYQTVLGFEQLRVNASEVEQHGFINGATSLYQHLSEQLELFKAKVEFYREETQKVREFLSIRNDIGAPCQPLYDAIFDKLSEQQQEIERLKGVMEKFYKDAFGGLSGFGLKLSDDWIDGNWKKFAKENNL